MNGQDKTEIASFRRGDSQATAPAFRQCQSLTCDHAIDLRRRSTFGVGDDGRLLCASCWQADIQELDASSKGGD